MTFATSIIYRVATIGAIGKLPASGTWASLVAMIGYIPISLVLLVWQQLLVVTLVSVAGIWICGSAANEHNKHYAQSRNNHDPRSIVWDELCGMWLALVGAPMLLDQYAFIYWLGAFILFRIFDIAKPWLIGWCDTKLRGGLGIMSDDVIAGLFTLAICQCLWTVWWWFL